MAHRDILRSAASRRAASVELGVDRPVRVPGELARLAAHHLAPQIARVGLERVRRQRRNDVPVAAVDLSLELTRAPAGVPGEDADAVHGGVDVVRLTLE